jgi:hypothetical protein
VKGTVGTSPSSSLQDLFLIVLLPRFELLRFVRACHRENQRVASPRYGAHQSPAKSCYCVALEPQPTLICSSSPYSTAWIRASVSTSNDPRLMRIRVGLGAEDGVGVTACPVKTMPWAGETHQLAAQTGESPLSSRSPRSWAPPARIAIECKTV